MREELKERAARAGDRIAEKVARSENGPEAAAFAARIPGGGRIAENIERRIRRRRRRDAAIGIAAAIVLAGVAGGALAAWNRERDAA